MKIKQELTDKTMYRSIKFLHQYLKYDVNHEAYKHLWFDKIETRTKAEKDVKNYINALKYLMANQAEGLTKELIRISYYLLTNHRLSERRLEYILTEYYSKKEQSAHINAAMMHQIIYGMKISNSVRYAHLLTKYILMTQKYSAIILYPSEIGKYQYALKYIESDWTIMYGFFVANELHVRKNDQKISEKPFSTSKEELINCLLLHKDEVREKYRITDMYLYGSLTKDFVHSSSDIDFLVVMDDKDMAVYEKYQMIDLCKKYLENLLEIRVDLIDIKTAIMQFGTKGIQRAVKII